MPAPRQTHSTDISVAFLNPQKPGKKNASLKTEGGDFYIVSPEIYSTLVVGGKYKIDYSSFKAQSGDVLRTIEKAEPSGSPAPVAKYQAGKYGVDDDKIAERIFVSGIIQRALAASASPFGVTEDMLVDEVNKLRSVWRRTFGNPQQGRGDMDDEIPY